MIQALQRPRTVHSIHEAVSQSPPLQRLGIALEESQKRLQMAKAFLPDYLACVIHAGPLQDGQWCLLVPSNSLASKLRQWVPTLIDCLQQQGLKTTEIRVKVYTDINTSTKIIKKVKIHINSY